MMTNTETTPRQRHSIHGLTADFRDGRIEHTVELERPVENCATVYATIEYDTGRVDEAGGFKVWASKVYRVGARGGVTEVK